VVDVAGDRIGTIERSYVDDDGAVQMVSVKMGRLFAKHRLVPVDGLHPQGDTLRIPYPRQLVEQAPEVDADDDVTADAADRVRLHYATLRDVPSVGSDADEEARPQATQRDIPADDRESVRATGIRDEGDVIEVPIVEEELVKRPVVKEVVRVRKETLTRQQPVETTLRREGLVVDERGDIDVTAEDVRAAEATGGSRHEPPPTPAEQRRFAAEGPLRSDPSR
jgi:uncharacterized protein DUF2382/PRC-barrel domain protein